MSSQTESTGGLSLWTRRRSVSGQHTDWKIVLQTCISSSVSGLSPAMTATSFHTLCMEILRHDLGISSHRQSSRNLFSPESGTEGGCQQLFTKFTITQPHGSLSGHSFLSFLLSCFPTPTLPFFQPQTSNPLSLSLRGGVWGFPLPPRFSHQLP